MRKKVFIYITILFCFTAQSQKNLNTVISIDDKIAASYNVENVHLIFSNEDVLVSYESGRVIINDDDYNKFMNYDDESIIILKLDYNQECPYYHKHTYEISIEKKFLTQQYFNISIYNYKNYPNLFGKKEGYGFEFKSPIISQSLPKNKKKHIIPICKD